MRLPSTNPVTLLYGAASAPYSVANPHAGTDYSHDPDPYSYAPENIVITGRASGSDCGEQLDFRSTDGTRTYRFCHSSEIYVSVGQQCPEGARLAKMGDTGLAAGVHLHFVMWVNGNRVDGDATLKQLIGGDNMQPITPSELDDLCGMAWGVKADPNHHANWDGKPFYEAYIATYNDPRTFEYADRCYKAIHGDHQVTVDGVNYKKG